MMTEGGVHPCYFKKINWRQTHVEKAAAKTRKGKMLLWRKTMRWKCICIWSPCYKRVKKGRNEEWQICGKVFLLTGEMFEEKWSGVNLWCVRGVWRLRGGDVGLWLLCAWPCRITDQTLGTAKSKTSHPFASKKYGLFRSVVSEHTVSM